MEAGEGPDSEVCDTTAVPRSWGARGWMELLAGFLPLHWFYSSFGEQSLHLGKTARAVADAES